MRQYWNALTWTASRHILFLLLIAISLPVAGCGGGQAPSLTEQEAPPPPPPPPPPPILGSSGPSIETCNNPGNILPAGSADSSGNYEDLQISNGTHCVVDGSAPGANYVYRNVNIWGGGSLTFNDTKINFHAHSILIESGGSMFAGFDAPLTGPLSIWLYGAGSADGLTIDSIPSITCQSSPTCGVPTEIWNSNPNVATMTMPGMNNTPSRCEPASTALPNNSSSIGNDCFYQYEVFDKGGTAGAFFGDKVLALAYGGASICEARRGSAIHRPLGYLSATTRPTPAPVG